MARICHDVCTGHAIGHSHPAYMNEGSESLPDLISVTYNAKSAVSLIPPGHWPNGVTDRQQRENAACILSLLPSLQARSKNSDWTGDSYKSQP